jgi:hypothetical protein
MLEAALIFVAVVILIVVALWALIEWTMREL